MPEIRPHKRNLSDFQDGWVVGDFSPSLHRTSLIEVGFKEFKEGEFESCHIQLSATEITVVIRGEIRLAGLTASEGELIEIPPLVHGSFHAVSSCQLMVIKFPSKPGDKVICKEH